MNCSYNADELLSQNIVSVYDVFFFSFYEYVGLNLFLRALIGFSLVSVEEGLKNLLAEFLSL